MKKEYSSPDLELTQIIFTSDGLTISDPEPTVPGGGGGSSDDPFEEL